MTKSHHLLLAVFAMCVAVTASNVLVQYPFHWFGFEHLLTYGAFTYPFAFLINDLTNRRYGPQAARRIVYAGFVSGLVVSWILASPRIAIASGTAFLFAQLLDITVFNPLRRKTWWIAPLAAAITGSALDTVWFFGVAFSSHFSFIDTLTGYSDGSNTTMTNFLGLDIPVWLSLSFGDFGVKLVMGISMLLPYGAILAIFMPDIYNGKTDPKSNQAA